MLRLEFMLWRAPLSRKGAWETGRAAVARLALEALGPDIGAPEASGVLEKAREVANSHGDGAEAVFAAGPDRTLVVRYALATRSYAWQVTGEAADASPDWASYAPQYARYRTASNALDGLLAIREAVEEQVEAAEAERSAAFSAWDRAGRPREKAGTEQAALALQELIDGDGED
jgi:hypothetical protein